MQMRYHTMRPALQAITIRSTPNSIKKCMSKYDLHLLRFDFNIIFSYLLIAHNNQIDSQEQIEVKELKMQDIEFKDKKDGHNIREEAKVQPRIGYKCSGIDCIICDLLFKLGLIPC